MKDIVILGGNSKKNIEWLNKMSDAYSLSYKVYSIFYESWRQEEKDIDINEELIKLKKYDKEHKDYIVVAKSMGTIITLLAIKNKIINPKLIILEGIPVKYIEDRNYDLHDLFIEANNKTKVYVIQQKNDYQCSSEKLIKEIPYFIPIITVPGKDHGYNDINDIKIIVDTIVNLNYISLNFNEVEASTLKDAIENVIDNKELYKYYNNWLFDPKNKLLAFNYDKTDYIIKRISKKQLVAEVKNAKRLKKILDNKKINNYEIKVNVPDVFYVNKKYYLVTNYYGKDLNQIFYENNYKYNKKFEETIKELCKILKDKDIIYNGFLPRNIILNDNKMHIIDFEDINTKSLIASETNFKIGWSYFFKNLNQLTNKLSENDNYDKLFKKYKFKYENPYQIALKAESKINNYKIDDIVNNLSTYIDEYTELLVDILLYELQTNNKEFLLNSLYALSEKTKVLGLLKSNKVKKIINNEIIRILKEIEKSEKKDIIKEYIKNYLEII